MILGDVDKGLEAWRRTPPEQGEALGRFLVFAEQYARGSYVDDPRYQEYLEEVGLGRGWSAYMREKVAELEPITGVQPSQPNVEQRVYSG